jgi:S-formylglutathione hydrolase FrmB
MVLLSRADDQNAPPFEPAAAGSLSAGFGGRRLGGTVGAHEAIPLADTQGFIVRLRRVRRWTPLTAVLLAVAMAAPARGADQGIQLFSSQRLDARLTELTLSTGALKAPTHVRVLLPPGYRKRKPRRYPVLYLLHGAFDDYRSWTDKGAAEAITAGRPLIVVMPDGGQGGWYTDWVNRGQGGPPEWETFHIGQLMPWIDDHYRTLRAGTGRAIAGLSMGGFGAMSYAARHPDLFTWAASFSGAVDIVNYLPVAAVIDLEAVVDDGLPGDQFGDRILDEANWRAHNPWDLAASLRGMQLIIDTGNGQSGPLDPPDRAFDPIENGVETMSVSLHERLLSLGIPHVWNDYGPGTHSWPYWQRDLREAIPSLMSTLSQQRKGKKRRGRKGRLETGWPAN